MSNLEIYSKGINNSSTVSARSIHRELGIRTRYNDWIKRIIDKGFVKDVDYLSVEGNKVTAQLNVSTYTDHYVDVNMAKYVLQTNSNSKKVKGILNWLAKYDDRDVILYEQPRKEHLFGDMLEGITGLAWDKQYPIDRGRYRLDFYLEGVLIVEYQEEHHKHQIDNDIERIDYCRDWIAEHEGDLGEVSWKTPVIFVNEGEELDGLNRIIRHLVGFEIISDRNYNLEPCDIGNR